MSRPPEQTENGLQRDRQDLFRILERARKNCARPKAVNEQLVHHLAEANAILTTEPGTYEEPVAVNGNGSGSAKKNGSERRIAR